MIDCPISISKYYIIAPSSCYGFTNQLNTDFFVPHIAEHYTKVHSHLDDFTTHALNFNPQLCLRFELCYALATRLYTCQAQ